MKKYCVIMNKEKALIVKEESKLPFSNEEAINELKKDYPDSEIKCFNKLNQAKSCIMQSPTFQAVFESVKIFADEIKGKK